MSRLSDDDDESRARLLRGIKRLQHLRLTCTVCGTVREVRRGYPIKMWRVIEHTDKLPAMVGVLCAKCCKSHLHFVDWPEHE